MNEKLKRCGPLNDAVKIAAQFLMWNFLLLLLLPLGTGLLFLTGTMDGKVAPLLTMIGMVIIISSPWFIAISLLLNEKGGAQDLCLLLRAFRSDERSDKFRAWLKAALGHKFKLSGIRPPRERASKLATVVSPLITGLRYLGSRQFEMEAPSHNWMARLLTSFGQARFVFVDVRDLTPHLLDEVRLAREVFGDERMVFVVDESRSIKEWSSAIAQHVDDQMSNSEFQLLVWPRNDEPDAASFAGCVKQIVNQIPHGTGCVTPASIKFVEQRVSEHDWDAQPLERPASLIVASIMAMNVLPLLLTGIPEIMWAIGWTLTLQVFFWRAWHRARRQRVFAKRINPAGPPSAARLWGSACSMLLCFFALIGFIGLGLAISKIGNPTGFAKQTAVRADVQSIGTQLQLYESMNDFYPTTEQGLQALVTPPSTDPRPARWYQFFKQVPKDPWGSDYIYRSPGLRNPGSYDLFSAGPDRKSNTDDDDWGEDFEGEPR